MKIKKYLLIKILPPFLFAFCFMVAKNPSEIHDEKAVTHSSSFHNTSDTHPSKKDKKEELIWFQYKSTPLYHVVNELAALQYNPLTGQKGITIMQPTGPNSLVGELTFSIPHQVSPETAWRYLLSILTIAGYGIEPGKDFSTIRKLDKNSSKEPLPLFVNVEAKDLPDDVICIYMLFLKNLQVPNASGGGSSLQTLLQNFLSPNSTVLFDPQFNALVIIDNSSIIKNVMDLINAFDTADLWNQEPLMVTLDNINASQVKALFDDIIPQNNINKGSGYFSPDIKIIVESRKNMLILLGKSESTQRIKTFIKEYIDVPLDKGKSILHIASLKYQQAETFAPILQQIVQDQSTSSSGQSTSSGGAGSGPQQFFKGVIVQPEVPSSGGSDSGSVQGGNRLIIAAVESDWIRIKKLIEELDQPQLQIVVRGLIVDMTYDDQRSFGTQLRNYTDFFVKNVNFQTGHIAGIETNSGYSTPNNPNPPAGGDSLKADLLGSNSSGYSAGNIASNATAGSFILSLTDKANNVDNGIWLITQILTRETDSKILYQPFLITTNNTPVTFKDIANQKIPGQASERFGVEVQEQEFKDATTSLNCTPRISQNGMVNLTLNVNINQWTGINNGQTTRNFTTNVNIKSGDILVIGGLTKKRVQNSISETPILSSIPVFGNLFRKRSKIITTTNLMTFIQVEVIYPMQTTQDKISRKIFEAAHSIVTTPDENFCNLHDPISHWFFGAEKSAVSPQTFKAFAHETEIIPFKKKVPMPSIRKGESSTPSKPHDTPETPLKTLVDDADPITMHAFTDSDNSLETFFKSQDSVTEITKVKKS